MRRGELQVRAFSEAMIYKLEARKEYGDWKKMPLYQLLYNLEHELYELKAALWGMEHNTTTKEDALYEAADVANYSMFIADKLGALLTEAAGTDVSPQGMAPCLAGPVHRCPLHEVVPEATGAHDADDEDPDDRLP